MAAGGSAPEFFTSIVGATIALWHIFIHDTLQWAPILHVKLGEIVEHTEMGGPLIRYHAS